MELERGVLRKERKDPKQGAMLRVWLDKAVKKSFSGRILNINEKTAQLCAQLHSPNPALKMMHG